MVILYFSETPAGDVYFLAQDCQTNMGSARGCIPATKEHTSPHQWHFQLGPTLLARKACFQGCTVPPVLCQADQWLRWQGSRCSANLAPRLQKPPSGEHSAKMKSG